MNKIIQAIKTASAESELLKLINEVDISVQKKDIIELRILLQRIEKKLKTEIETDKKYIKQLNNLFFNSLLVASSIAIIIITSFLINLLQKTTSLNEIIDQYSIPYEGRTYIRSLNSENSDSFHEGISLYNHKKYKESYYIFKNILISEPDNNIAALLTAISLLEINELDEARILLEQIINTNDILYSEDAKWYLSIAYLKSNKIEDAEILLDQISKTAGHYSYRSIELINTLSQKRIIKKGAPPLRTPPLP